MVALCRLGRNVMKSLELMSYIRDKGGITPLECLEEFGCMRLAARIYELKTIGATVPTVMVKNPMTKKKYARYIWVDTPRNRELTGEKA